MKRAGFRHVESHDFLPLQSFDVFALAGLSGELNGELNSGSAPDP